MGYRLGVDVGGTFTDLALYDADTNRLEFAKTPSTPDNQAVGVAAGIAELARRYGVMPEQVDFFIHGTTVATNTLLERKGAVTALVVTAGFRDVLQIGRQERPSLYDWRIRRPEPLAPRRLRFEVAERVVHTGEVLTPLTGAEIDRVVARLAAADVDAIAVCLLHSYANPAHERALGEALRRSLPGVTVALSHEVLPEFKEYERMSTTAINAYVSPVMERYLRRLEHTISDAGLKSELYIMQSNGGTMGVETAIERPVHTIMSGPAAGVIGAAAIARQAGHANAISIDMGGTSFDVSLCYQGEVRQTQESEIERLPIRVPMVDVHTLGAGGGSIAWIDAGGALRVGPSSAGAVPGPACYGSGGTQATVTDANVVLGRLGESGLLGGAMPLDAALARMAVRERIADPLGIGVEEAAEGIVQVVNASMVKGIRVVSVSKGYDPREFCLVAFGGAGPLHASELAEEMDIPRVLVPVAPGVTSALGLLVADLRHDFARTVLRPGTDITPRELTYWFELMETAGARADGPRGRDARPRDARPHGRRPLRWPGLRAAGAGGGRRVRAARRGRDYGATPRSARTQLRLRHPRQRRRGRQRASHRHRGYAASRPGAPRAQGGWRRLTRADGHPPRLFPQRGGGDAGVRAGAAGAGRHAVGAGDSRATGLDDGGVAGAVGLGGRGAEPGADAGVTG